MHSVHVHQVKTNEQYHKGKQITDTRTMYKRTQTLKLNVF